MRVGLVCPYSLDVPGGVQGHVLGLAERLIAWGHDVEVLAPAGRGTLAPPYVRRVTGAVPIPYNGSVARVAFGPVSAARVRRWLADTRLDVLHLHEPHVPSLSLLALPAARVVPTVVTFHTSIARSRLLHAVAPLLRPALAPVRAQLAVSEQARATVRRHLGGELEIVPNGLDVHRFRTAASGAARRPGTLCFLGRMDEPRKGLDLLARAMPAIVSAHPHARLLVAGPGDVTAARRRFGHVAPHVEVLGTVDDERKARLLAEADVYVAPQTAGESFGIVVAEAMASGATVVASDLPAFVELLGGGGAGVIFPAGDAGALAAAVGRVLAQPEEAQRLRHSARDLVQRYDWSEVARQLLDSYAEAVDGAAPAPVP